MTAAIDYTKQNPDGYAQVLAGVAPTLRAPYRQFNAIVADLGYTPVSLNSFERVTDTDTPRAATRVSTRPCSATREPMA